MWSTLPMVRAMAGRFVRAAAATAAATAALLAAAALVEGHPPRAETLRAVVGPLAGALGAAWALGGWRRERADIALAALGRRTALAPLGLLLMAAPLLGMAPTAGLDARPARIALAPGRLTAQLPAGTTEWRWTDSGIERRIGDGPPARLPALPPPHRRAPPQPGPAAALIGPALALAIRLAALALMLGWLAHGPAPGPPRVVAAASAAFVAGHGLSALVG